MDEYRNPRRRFLRFGLGALLLAVFCFAAVLAGYRRGYDSGIAQRANETVSAKIYYFDDYLDSEASQGTRLRGLQDLADLFTSTVESNSWQPIGMGEVQLMESNFSLVVSNTGDVHRQLDELVAQLREINNEYQAKTAADLAEQRILPALRSLSARRDESDTFHVAGVANEGPADARIAGQIFEKAVTGVTEHWGEPSLRSQSTEDRFPDWSRAFSIVCWKRTDGVVYLALEERDPKNLAIVAGYHND